MYNYNPLQSRYEQLSQQRQLIDQQLQSLQNMQMPPININNQITPNATNYDFGCKWVDSENELTNIPNNVIAFNKNEPIFYMGGKKFKFNEVVEETRDDLTAKRIDSLESNLKAILERLDRNDINTLPKQENSLNGSKSGKKGQSSNE